MNEQTAFRLFIVLIVITFLSGGAAGFFIGRGNPIGLANAQHANRELTATIGSLREELDCERKIAERVRVEQAEERELIATALAACRSAGGSVQGIITKMEVLNGLVRDLERRVGWSSNLPSSE